MLRYEVFAAPTAHSDLGLQRLVSSSWDTSYISAALTLSSQMPFVLSFLTSKALSQLFRESISFSSLSLLSYLFNQNISSSHLLILSFV